MQLTAEAFNLLNHQIITSVNTTHSQYIPVGSTVGNVKCNAGTAPSGSALQGCISPFVTSNPLSAFGVTSGTNNALYGPRQMQFIAKLFF